ncbi:hypothetical protein [Nocardia farcinica]|uniref:hypothetical protein n=1 Tax=Nocardia farcinica TaxID=37329 RepID=UPI002455B95B|nr:hypothetical protein [Nocardia farcinica]
MADSTDTPALFELPADAAVAPPEPQPMNRGQRRKLLVAKRIAAGTHPLGYVSIHPEATRDRTGPGLRCGTCRYRQPEKHHNRTYPKCHFDNGSRVSGCDASDIRAWWPACRDYEPKENEGA